MKKVLTTALLLALAVPAFAKPHSIVQKHPNHKKAPVFAKTHAERQLAGKQARADRKAAHQAKLNAKKAEHAQKHAAWKAMTPAQKKADLAARSKAMRGNGKNATHVKQ